MNKAIFLDRDGTINSDEGHYYIYKVEDFVFNPGVIDGIRRLNEAGYLIIIVTNQGGVAKGEYSIEDVDNLHAHMSMGRTWIKYTTALITAALPPVNAANHRLT